MHRPIAAFLLSIPLVIAQAPAQTKPAQTKPAQTKEAALSKAIETELLKSGPPVENEPLQSYVKTVGAKLAANRTFTVIPAGMAPIALPEGTVFVPLNTLTDAKDEAEFAEALARAVSIPANSHWTGALLPGALQEQTNRAAALLAAQAGFRPGVNSEEFSRIQAGLKPKPRTPPTLFAK
jgi:hypothetical protein